MDMLIISGLDPSGGAGLLQDVMISSGLRYKSRGVVSAFTVQNEQEVKAVEYRDVELIKTEIINLPPPQVIKLGIVTPQLLEILSEIYPDILTVWNPVLQSSSGYHFLNSQQVNQYLNYADWVVVNHEEAKILGIRENMVITGGHIREDNIPIFIGEQQVYSAPRLPGDYHGTGCAFSTAFSAFLGYGYDPDEAVRSAADFIYKIISESEQSVESYKLSSSWLIRDICEQLKQVMGKLADLADKITPEVGLNISYALPGAATEQEVANIPGRMRLVEDQGCWCSEPEMGQTSHTARMILAMGEKFPHIRCCVNICYSEYLIKKAKQENYLAIELNRPDEPEDLQRVEGSSLKWGVSEVIKDLISPPDFIWDRGFWGKEAMIRVFARNPQEALEKITSIIGDS